MSLDWFDQGACKGKTWMTLTGNESAAREVCALCPVLRECKTWVLTDPVAATIPGVIAGWSPTDRGLVVCVDCGNVNPIKKTRRQKCWPCYTSVETFEVVEKFVKEAI